jgi:ELWxxDGT repeat protein
LKIFDNINKTQIGSSIQNPCYYNGAIYFSVNDSEHGQELWKSNGSYDTTVILKDINPGFHGSKPSSLVISEGYLYFVADDGEHGNELWCSDGTTNGTNLVYDINTNGNSLPSYLTSDGNYLYFAANDGVNGIELWRTYQTPSGGHQTVLVKDINQTSGAPSNPNRLTFFKNKLYFSAEDGSNRYKLWTSDGTSGGTKLVTNLYSGNSYLHPANFDCNLKLFIFFSLFPPTWGRVIYLRWNKLSADFKRYNAWLIIFFYQSYFQSSQ